MSDTILRLDDPVLKTQLSSLRLELTRRAETSTSAAVAEDLASTPSQLLDEHSSDFLLASFLLGYDLDVGKTADAVNATQKFISENQVDRIRAKVREGLTPAEFPFCEKVTAAWSHDLCGFNLPLCRDGMPVATARIGLIDLETLGESVPLEEFKQYMIYVMEYRLMVLESRTQELGGLICRFVDVHDLYCPKGLYKTFANKHLGLLKCWLTMLGPHYPEMVRKVFLVNAPKAFHAGWRMVKNWLPQKTLDKIAILPTEFGELRLMVDPERLPIHLGVVDADDDTGKTTTLEGPSTGDATVPAGACVKMTTPLKKGEVIKYTFNVADHDVSFSACYVVDFDEATAVPVVASCKHSAAAGPLSGTHAAREDCLFVCHWDNSYSWMRSKCIKYTVVVGDE